MNLGDIEADKTAFFLCDMQERFRPAIKHFPDILEVTKRLVRNNIIWANDSQWEGANVDRDRGLGLGVPGRGVPVKAGATCQL